MLEHQIGDDREHSQRDAFLQHFQLYEIEWATVADEADPIGWHLTAVFEEGDTPREKDDAKQRPMSRRAGLLQFQVPVPGEGHKDVAQREKH